MYTAADVNLTSPDIYPDYNNRSNYEDYETSGMTNYSRHDEIDILLKMAIPFYGIIFALGTIGNGIVIWIAGFRMKKIISAVWFLNLAIADFLCCASLPLRIAEWVYVFPNYQERDIICVVSIILFNLNMGASVLLLVAMSIDRCVSIMWPFWAKVHRTRKLVRITAAIIWVMSLLLTCLMLYFYIIHVNAVKEWCSFFSGGYSGDYIQGIKQTIQLIRLFIMFVIPFLIILINYVIIFFKLIKSKRPQRSQRPYRIITAVILCFFICWSPYYIWPLFYDDTIEYVLFYAVNTIIVSLASLNSCINPIIYVLIGQDVKLGFFRSIPSRVEKALSEHPNDLCREQEDCEHSRTTEV